MQKDPWIRRNLHFPTSIALSSPSSTNFVFLLLFIAQKTKTVRCPHRSVTLPPWCSGTPPEKSPTPNLSKSQEQKSPNPIESKDKISVNNGSLESRIRVRVFRCTDEGSAGGEIGGSEGREMSLTAAEEEEQSPTPSAAAEIRLPAEVDWEMLDKSRFFILGAALFSGVSFALYPAVVLKTRLQVSRPPLTCTAVCASILRREGPSGFYRGFATSLTGTIPARALYMAALEVTKSAVGAAAVKFGVPDPAAAAAANAAAGLSAAVAAQIVWTPIDVISQRLMVRDSKYTGGIDAVKKIVRSDGIRGLYRGFGMSILTYAPSNAVWWASYSVSQRAIWGGIGYYFSHFARRREANGDGDGAVFKPNYATVAAVQGASAAMAGGAAAVVTMPLDTIKTRMQVMDSEEGGKSIGRTVRVLLKEGGWGACYRGLGPRWASMSLSATTMITTYEFLKRLSAKNQDFSSI